MAFEGKVAFITGAGSGMGQLAARKLAAAGVEVAAVDVNEAGLVETARDERKVHPYKVDVTDTAAVERLVAEVEGSLGPIDRVYNAAAIMPTGMLIEQNARTINRVMEVNYNGLVNVTMSVLPGMLRRGRGDLINFASIAGWIPSLHFGAYDASKFAVVAFTEVLAHENRRRGVRFCCVCPPPVRTPLLDQATSKPRVFSHMFRPMKPDAVLREVEAAIEAGELFVFPGTGTSLIVRIRRFLPGVAWTLNHKIEGI